VPGKAVGILLLGSSAGFMSLTSTDKHADVCQRCCRHVTVDVLQFRASHLQWQQSDITHGHDNLQGV